MIPEKAIEKAKAAGWSTYKFSDFPSYEEIALDPGFWQALGKVKGWTKERAIAEGAYFCRIILLGRNPEIYWNDILEI